MANELDCLACGKALESAFYNSTNQPYGANVFISHGLYGSTVFDPMDGSFIEINICSDCLVAAAKKGRVLYCKKTPNQKRDASAYSNWSYER